MDMLANRHLKQLESKEMIYRQQMEVNRKKD